MVDCPFKHLLVLDFETTCKKEFFDYPREIIQFSVVAIEVDTNTILENISFNEYVRPVHNPILSDFCTELTGITQESVDAADTFEDVYDRFLIWLKSKGFEEKCFAIVTDSRLDMWHIAQYQFYLIKVNLPSMFRQWINMKTIFDSGLEAGEREKLIGETNMEKMMNKLDIEPVGRAHNAHFDCLNLARITKKILGTGVHVNVNEMLSCSGAWRKKPLDVSTIKDWKTNFPQAVEVFLRILPLVVQRISNYDISSYGFCRYCKSGPTICGTRHRQWPATLYQHFAEIGESSDFADVAKFRH